MNKESHSSAVRRSERAAEYIAAAARFAVYIEVAAGCFAAYTAAAAAHFETYIEVGSCSASVQLTMWFEFLCNSIYEKSTDFKLFYILWQRKAQIFIINLKIRYFYKFSLKFQNIGES